MESKIAREEQIKQAEIKYSNDTLFDGCDYIGQVAKQEAFIAGAEWADKTMIDKACKWLSDNKDNYIIDIEGETLIDDQIITDFRKAMEE
jgi:hypothetical protein